MVLILLVGTFLSPNIYSKCKNDAIVYKRQSGFGISFSSDGLSSNFNEKESINVPLSINDEAACYIKKSKYQIQLEENNGLDFALRITPLKAEFDNVPEPSVKNYIFADKSDDPTQIKFYSMSFICSNEIPISVEAFSESVIDLKIKQSAKDSSVNINTVFATGKAAENLQTKYKDLKAEEAYLWFSKKYAELGEVKNEVDCCGMKIPSIFSSTSIETMTGIEQKIAKSFTTKASQFPNGCSKDFSEKMKTYLLENYKQNESLKSFQIKTKFFSDDLIFNYNNKK